MPSEFAQTERTKIKRLPKRGVFDRDVIYKILDEGFVCHLGFSAKGQPFVIPTAYARDDNDLLIHGSAASRTMKTIANGIDVCVTVTHVDGLVLARSAFHHSINYRSVVVFGKAKLVTDEAEKANALKLFTEHIVPNRWKDIREPNENEIKGTTVLRLPIDEASAKIREGGPVDDDEDMSLDCWAGVIPVKTCFDKPIDDEKLTKNIAPPDYVKSYKR